MSTEVARPNGRATSQTGHGSSELGERATQLWRSRAAALLLAALFVAAFARFLLTGLQYGVAAWFGEELPPLVDLLVHGTPIDHIDPRQYGVVVFLLLDPWIRVTGGGFESLSRYTLVLAVAAIVAAYVLIAMHYCGRNWRGWLLLGAAWFSAAPTLYVVAQRIVDAWDLLFLSAALVLFTAPDRRRYWTGVPLGIAAMTKILPGLLLVYVLVRGWRSGISGIATVGLLMALGQLLYGTLMGFGYPLAILGAGGSTVAAWSQHYENNSIRGLIFKVGAGFQLQGGSVGYVLSPGMAQALNVVAYVAAAALVVYLLAVAWLHRGEASPNGRAAELGLAITIMLLVSPHTAHDYTIALLPVFATWAVLFLARWPRHWPWPVAATAALSVLLVGVFVPLSIALRLLPVSLLLQLTHNSGNTLFTDAVGSGIGAYDFFGFPGLGLLLSLAVGVWLERASGRQVEPAEAAGPRKRLLATPSRV